MPHAAWTSKKIEEVCGGVQVFYALSDLTI